jgi:uncharacterized protein
MYATRQGARAAARLLVEFGADLDVTDPDGTSALMFAIINGHYDVAADLLDAGADPNLPDRTGMTPLYAAIDIHTLASTFGRPDLTRNVVDGSVDAVRNLLAHGANPNARLRTRILKRVYNAGDPRLGEGATPFMRAARGADVSVMRLLLDAGADPALVQANGNSPLLLAVGADVRYREANDGGVDARAEAVNLCLDHGADVNAANAAGDTAAHLAATTRSGSPEILRLLSKRGARLDLENKQGRTALDAALRSRDINPDTVAVLRELGAVSSATDPIKESSAR